MKARITIFVFLFAFLTSNVFSNGVSLNSPGPKGLGMGGAMIGVADDMTALYWNPAGLTQLKGAQVGIFVTDIMPMATYENSTYGINAETKSNHYISPNIMGYIPLMEGDLAIGLGVYVPSGLGTEWNGDDLANLSAGQSFEWMSKVAAFNISPGVAYKINDMLSVGVALNVYYGMFEIKRMNTADYEHFGQYTEESDGTGIGFAGGLLVKPIDMLSVGLSFKTKSTIAFSGDATATGLPDTEFERDVDWPMWFGFGIAVKPIDKLTLAFDGQFSKWSESMEVLLTKYTAWNSEQEMHMYWEDCWQFRFGANYEVNEDLDVRCGIYHDPAPAPDETMNILFPSNTYLGVTLGGSYKITKCISTDIGFEYLMGDDRDIPIDLVPEHDGATYLAGIHHTDIIAFSLGFNYFFK